MNANTFATALLCEIPFARYLLMLLTQIQKVSYVCVDGCGVATLLYDTDILTAAFMLQLFKAKG